MVAGPATLSIVQEPPTSVVAGSDFGFEVETEDQYGNPTTNLDGSTLTANLVEKGGNTNPSLSGPVTAVVNNGIAVFSSLKEDQASASFTGGLTIGSAVVTGLSSMTGLVAGEPVAGAGIPAGATIQSVNTLTSPSRSRRMRQPRASRPSPRTTKFR